MWEAHKENANVACFFQVSKVFFLLKQWKFAFLLKKCLNVKMRGGKILKWVERQVVRELCIKSFHPLRYYKRLCHIYNFTPTPPTQLPSLSLSNSLASLYRALLKKSNSFSMIVRRLLDAITQFLLVYFLFVKLQQNFSSLFIFLLHWLDMNTFPSIIVINSMWT